MSLRDSAEFEGIVLLFVEKILNSGMCRISDRQEFADAVEIHLARDALNHDRVTGDNWVQVNQALLHALALLGELRAALKASRP